MIPHTNLLELKNKKAINSFKTDKTAANGNLRLNLKSKPQAKCHWSLSIGLTPENDIVVDFRHSSQARQQPQKGQIMTWPRLRSKNKAYPPPTDPKKGPTSR